MFVISCHNIFLTKRFFEAFNILFGQSSPKVHYSEEGLLLHQYIVHTDFNLKMSTELPNWESQLVLYNWFVNRHSAKIILTYRHLIKHSMSYSSAP